MMEESGIGADQTNQKTREKEKKGTYTKTRQNELAR
jgi:hypothetical protein